MNIYIYIIYLYFLGTNDTNNKQPTTKALRGCRVHAERRATHACVHMPAPTLPCLQGSSQLNERHFGARRHIGTRRHFSQTTPQRLRTNRAELLQTIYKVNKREQVPKRSEPLHEPTGQVQKLFYKRATSNSSKVHATARTTKTIYNSTSQQEFEVFLADCPPHP